LPFLSFPFLSFSVSFVLGLRKGKMGLMGIGALQYGPTVVGAAAVAAVAWWGGKAGWGL